MRSSTDELWLCRRRTCPPWDCMSVLDDAYNRWPTSSESATFSEPSRSDTFAVHRNRVLKLANDRHESSHHRGHPTYDGAHPVTLGSVSLMRTRTGRAGEWLRPESDDPDGAPQEDSGQDDLGPDGECAFREYVTARGAALLRIALLLTGNRADAEDLLQAALAKTYLAWDRIHDRAALDAYVKRAMVNTQISWWRRRRVEEFPTEDIPDWAVAEHLPPSGARGHGPPRPGPAAPADARRRRPAVLRGHERAGDRGHPRCQPRDRQEHGVACRGETANRRRTGRNAYRAVRERPITNCLPRGAAAPACGNISETVLTARRAPGRRANPQGGGPCAAR